MLTLLGPRPPTGRARFCDALPRRDFLRIGALGVGGLGGLSLPRILEAEASAGAIPSGKALIMIYLPGGPPHIDLFDPKPDAPREIRGPFGRRKTAVEGLWIGELLPELARLARRLVFVRSLVGAENRHESFQCYTGRPGGKPQDREPAGGWPTLGSAVSKLLGPALPGVPPYADAGPRMSYGPYNNRGQHDAGGKSSWPGFLGNAHTPFAIEGEGRNDLVIEAGDLRRLGNRRRLLARLDRLRRALDGDPFTAGLTIYQRQALSILSSSRLAAALDLEREDPRVLERYGRAVPTTASFGGAPKSPHHFLLARRLVEAGVRVVTVAFGAWDWHGNRGGPLEKLGREDFPALDRALSTLIEDLEGRGLLDDVGVVVWGEFGRTPKINAKGGRDHWTKVSCALLLGGGLRGGLALGATDAHGAEPRERPVHFQEVFATLYRILGIDAPRTTVTDLNGRPHYLVDSGYEPIRELF